MLYLNGESLLQSTFEERRTKLHASFSESKGKFEYARHWEGNTMEQIEGFLTESIEAGGEGLMVKTLRENATYEPSKRSLNWLKLKKDYIDGMGDSLDLVPIAAYFGKGKRVGTYVIFFLFFLGPSLFSSLSFITTTVQLVPGMRPRTRKLSC
jgi:DNA ligase-1